MGALICRPYAQVMRFPLLIGSLAHSSGGEASFEAVVERSERLAREHARHEPSAFDELVTRAIDRLPDEFQRQLEGVAVVV